MAFDQSTRNRLARFVGDVRNLLTEEFTRQLQNEYGLDPESGTVTGLEKLTAQDDTKRETARILRETLEYYLAGKADDKKNRQDVLQRIVREQAFTVLNRLCALRMAESRGILIESIAKGYQSKGFQLYARLAGNGLGETGDAYSSYLFSLFDEFAVDLAVLFDRFNPQGRLFPRQTALVKLLDLINDLEIEQLWAEDETIGWMYQYFNTKEERKEMRDASQAPRNSRELAVRNQFFTPRYVVEFLTDNTLGRIWYEMTQGETSLKDSCHYLVRRPTEIFLKDGEVAPAQESDESLSQEELLKQPVYIPHRLLKDPREIKMLDPACGSMHFGLYAFDLFEQIYAEAWDLKETQGDAHMRLGDFESLHTTYQTREGYLRDVPRLIIERNIHGVDIDPRAVQIAGLSLWLRAQKSWHAQGVKPQDRPQIRRSNIVCAEPMPGDRTLLEEFLQTFKEDRLEALMRRVLHVPAGQKVRATKAMAEALANLVRTVWQEMELAGEAGSLLQIEVTLRDAIEKASSDSKEKTPLFSVLEFGADNLSQNASSDIDSNFWSRAEALVLEALREYAEQSENDGNFRRRLFTGDATQGFAFIDLCRKQYDAVVMNPPFGLSTYKIKEYLDQEFEEGKVDLAAVMVQRNVRLLEPKGVIGVLATRSLLSLSSFERWRVQYLLSIGALACVADLGYGVLDAALVEAAAFVIDMSCKDACFFFNSLDFVDKEKSLSMMVKETQNGVFGNNIYYQKPSVFSKFPAAVVAYMVIDSFAKKILLWETLEDHDVRALKGLNTSDDERYLRTSWEVNPSDIGIDKTWQFLVKGGEWNPFWDDVHLLLNWKDKGKSILLSGGDIRNPIYYFKPGLTYPLRTTSSFGPRVLPSGCIFSTGGLAISFEEDRNPLCYLGLLLSRVGQLLIELSLGGGDSSVSGTAARNYTNGMINRLPFPIITNDVQTRIAELVQNIVELKKKLFEHDETSRNFTGPIIINNISGSVQEKLKFSLRSKREIADLFEQVEDISEQIFELTMLEKNMISELIGPSPYRYKTQITTTEESIVKELFGKSESDLIELVKRKLGKGSRYITKNSQMVDRKLELISHYLNLKLQVIIDVVISSLGDRDVYAEKKLLSEDIFSYCMGATFGRWDFRVCKNPRRVNANLTVFSALPANSPGSLVGEEGMPIAKEFIFNTEYPISIPWSGILSNDAGHLDNLENRMRKVIHLIWGESAEVIEQEACQLIGIHSLTEYFSRPAQFFVEHLSRYSKSRRQAPIYWPLSTPSNSYTLWLYYHRLNDQTLFTCVNDFVDPKIKQVSEETKNLRQKKSRSTTEEKDLERLTDFEHELKDFRDELLRVAKFWKPNLNDGVQITAAPLWKLFQHKPWQKKLRETWESLEAGEYDWAHLANSIWPDRVREKCKSDKSLAIAHDLEHLYVDLKAPLKKTRKSKQAKAPSFLTEEDE